MFFTPISSSVAFPPAYIHVGFLKFKHHTEYTLNIVPPVAKTVVQIFIFDIYIRDI